jgi:hypothetical protein
MSDSGLEDPVLNAGINNTVTDMDDDYPPEWRLSGGGRQSGPQ